MTAVWWYSILSMNENVNQLSKEILEKFNALSYEFKIYKQKIDDNYDFLLNSNIEGEKLDPYETFDPEFNNAYDLPATTTIPQNIINILENYKEYSEPVLTPTPKPSPTPSPIPKKIVCPFNGTTTILQNGYQIGECWYL